MENFFIELADDIYNVCIYKLNFLSTSKDKILSEIAENIKNHLDLEKQKISDKYDLKDFRSKAMKIQSLLGILSSTQKAYSNWIKPLIKTCYQNLSIDLENRSILIAHSVEYIYPLHSEGFGLYIDILSNFTDCLPDDLTKNILDVFVVPSEAYIDIKSLAILGHEIGHIFWRIHSDKFEDIISTEFEDYYKAKVPKKVAQEKLLFLKFEEQEIFLSHTQEVFCDKIGRKLFNAVFDIATINILKDVNITKGTMSHPPPMHRLNNSYNELDDFVKQQNSLSDLIKSIVDNYYPREPLSYIYDKKEQVDNAIDKIFLEILNHSITISELTEIEEIWHKVSFEIDNFRPPIETTKDSLLLINPIEVVFGCVLYSFNKKHIKDNNLYFKNSSEDNEQRKYDFIKGKLVDHLIFSINNYEFANSVIEKVDINFDNLKNTLWSLRQSDDPLVIHPESQYSYSAVDLRLGCHFLVHKTPKYTHISPYPNEKKPINECYEEIYIEPAGELILHPHQLILASTLEYVCLPNSYFGLILGRSSWGRMGLNIATAITVQPGYKGCITLELRNLGETPLQLNVGVRIAQLCLVKVPLDTAENIEYYTNKDRKYIGPVKTEYPKIDKDIDWDILFSFDSK